MGTPIIAVDVPGGGRRRARQLPPPPAPAAGGQRAGGTGPGAPSRLTARGPPPRTWCRRSPRPRSGRPSWSGTGSRPARPPGGRARQPPLRPAAPVGRAGALAGSGRCGPSPARANGAAGRPRERAGQAAGAQAGPGPRRRPGRAGRHRAGRVDHPGRCAAGRPDAAPPAAASAGRRRPSPGPPARSGFPSGGCASTPRRRWWPARSPRRT